MSDPDTARRRWRLLGYSGKELVHEGTCVGDQALDLAMRDLERAGIRPVAVPA